jgi:hypothetical protein
MFEFVCATRKSAGVMKVASSPKLIPALFIATNRKWQSVPGGKSVARLLTEPLPALVNGEVILE